MERLKIPLCSLAGFSEALMQPNQLSSNPSISHLQLPTGSGKSYLVGKGFVRAVSLFEKECREESRQTVGKRWLETGRIQQIFGDESSQDDQRNTAFRKLIDALVVGPITVYYIAQQHSELNQFNEDCENSAICISSKKKFYTSDNWKDLSKKILDFLSGAFNDKGFTWSEIHPLKDDLETTNLRLGDIFAELGKNHASALAIETSMKTDKGATTESTANKIADLEKKLCDFYSRAYDLFCFLAAFEVTRPRSWELKKRHPFSLSSEGDPLFKLFLPMYFDRFGSQIYMTTADKAMAGGAGVTDLMTPLGVMLDVDLEKQVPWRSLVINGLPTWPKKVPNSPYPSDRISAPLSLLEFIHYFRPGKRSLVIFEEEEACHKIMLEWLTRRLVKEGTRSGKNLMNSVRITEFHSNFSRFFSLNLFTSQRRDEKAQKAYDLLLERIDQFSQPRAFKPLQTQFWDPLAEQVFAFQLETKQKPEKHIEILYEHAKPVLDLLNSLASDKPWTLEESALLLEEVFSNHDVSPSDGFSGNLKFLHAKLKAHKSIASNFARLKTASASGVPIRQALEKCQEFFYHYKKSIVCPRDLYNEYCDLFQNILFAPNAQIIGTEFLDKIGLRISSRGDSLEMFQLGVKPPSEYDYITLTDYLLFTLVTINVCRRLLQSLDRPNTRGKIVNENERLLSKLYMASAKFKSMNLDDQSETIERDASNNLTIDEHYIFEQTKSLFSLLPNQENLDGSSINEVEVFLDASQLRGTPERLIRDYCGQANSEPLPDPMIKCESKEKVKFFTSYSQFLVQPIAKHVLFISATAGTNSPLMGFNRKFLSRAIYQVSGKTHFTMSQSEKAFCHKLRQQRAFSRKQESLFFSSQKTDSIARDFQFTEAQKSLFDLLLSLFESIEQKKTSNTQTSIFAQPNTTETQTSYYQNLAYPKKLEIFRTIGTLCALLTEQRVHAFAMNQTNRHIVTLFNGVLELSNGPALSKAQKIGKAIAVSQSAGVFELVLDLSKINNAERLVPGLNEHQFRPIRIVCVDATAMAIARASANENESAAGLDNDDDTLLSGIEKLFDITDKNLLVITTYGTFSKGLNAFASYVENDTALRQDPAIFALTISPWYNDISNVSLDKDSAISLRQQQLCTTYAYEHNEPDLQNFKVEDVLLLQEKYQDSAFSSYNLAHKMWQINQALGRPDRLSQSAPDLKVFMDSEVRLELVRYFSSHPQKKHSLTHLQANYLDKALNMPMAAFFKRQTPLSAEPSISGWIEQQIHKRKTYRRVVDELVTAAVKDNNLAAQRLYGEIKYILAFEPNSQGFRLLAGLDYSSISDKLSASDIQDFPNACFESTPKDVTTKARLSDVVKFSEYEIKSLQGLNESYLENTFKPLLKSHLDFSILFPKDLCGKNQSADDPFSDLLPISDLAENIFRHFMLDVNKGKSDQFPIEQGLLIQPWAFESFAKSEVAEQFARWYIARLIRTSDEFKRFELRELGVVEQNRLGIFEKADLFYVGKNALSQNCLYAMDSKYWRRPDSSTNKQAQARRLSPKREACEKAAIKLGLECVNYAVFNHINGSRGITLLDDKPQLEGFAGTSTYCSFTLSSEQIVESDAGPANNQKNSNGKRLSTMVLPHFLELSNYFKSGGL